jgi:hypothetical protein
MNWKALIRAAALLAHAFPSLGLPTHGVELSTRQSLPKYVFAHFMVSRKIAAWKEVNLSQQD